MGGWSDWWEVPGRVTGYASACARKYGRIDLFSLGENFLPVHKTDPFDVNSPWKSLGQPGSLGVPPAVVSMGQEYLDAFFHFGYHNSYNGLKATPWTGFQRFDCQSQHPIAVCSWGPQRMDLFACDRDGTLAMKHRWYDHGAWSGWEDLGGEFFGGVAAACWAPGRIDLFGVGFNNRAIWHKWFDAGHGWSGWESMGGITNDAPSAASWGPGRLDLFHTGLDQAVYHKWFDAGIGWSGWESLGGYAWSGTATASPGPGRLAVFHRGRENTIWARRFGF
ncbi:hypothetical protein ACH4SP_02480 [Streptomyces sp. NPDC021093]|uniref:hypothetical protein n=1 Tax=Streptomyces sp. NPDC021093 TaxID=3365112 RepID=UPI0037B9949C